MNAIYSNADWIQQLSTCAFRQSGTLRNGTVQEQKGYGWRMDRSGRKKLVMSVRFELTPFRTSGSDNDLKLAP